VFIKFSKGIVMTPWQLFPYLYLEIKIYYHVTKLYYYVKPINRFGILIIFINVAREIILISCLINFVRGQPLYRPDCWIWVLSLSQLARLDQCIWKSRWNTKPPSLIKDRKLLVSLKIGVAFFYLEIFCQGDYKVASPIQKN